MPFICKGVVLGPDRIGEYPTLPIPQLVDKEVHDCLMAASEIDALRLSRENGFLVLTIERET